MIGTIQRRLAGISLIAFSEQKAPSIAACVMSISKHGSVSVVIENFHHLELGFVLGVATCLLCFWLYRWATAKATEVKENSNAESRYIGSRQGGPRQRAVAAGFGTLASVPR